MSAYRIEVRKPHECPDTVIEEFVRIVEKAGEVGNGVGQRVRRAAFLGMIYVSDQMVGTAAIKNPASTYRNKVFCRAGVGNIAEKYHFELGWIHILPEYRGNGYANTLVETTLRNLRHKGAFATTRESNSRMQRVLERVGFEGCGTHYVSSQAENEFLALYVRNSTA